MGVIVCATRGGEASLRTQERAIALAKEQSARLIFLHVVSAETCEGLPHEMAAVVQDELTRIGHSLLHIACARARQQGIEPEMAVRCGHVRQTIKDFLREVQADVLVIGKPQATPEHKEFNKHEAQAFAQEVAAEVGVEVELV